jgi:DNA-directed RNA polymerase subunit RPC12/RpoP
MPKVLFSCSYCGYSWSEHIIYYSEMENMRCEKCNDKNVIKNKVKYTDYYSDKLEFKDEKDNE